MDEVKIVVILFVGDNPSYTELSRTSVEAAASGMDVEIKEVTTPGERLMAIQQAMGEYILLMNSGTVPGEDILRSLCYFMDEKTGIGATGIKMLDGHGCFIPDSKRSYPSFWSKLCVCTGLSSLFSSSALFNSFHLPKLNADKKHKEIMLNDTFMMLRRDAVDKAGLPELISMKYDLGIELSSRLCAGGNRNCYLPERIVYLDNHIKPKRNLHHRLLVFAGEDSFEEVKSACVKQMPGLEYVNLWDLDVNRVMDAICRSNRMKKFTDIVFCYPDVRFEQMALLMDKMPDEKLIFHIYIKKKKVLASPVR